MMATIYVVEDESIVSLDLQNTLKKLGYDIAGTAVSGEDAVEQVRKASPDLVLMDINLKGEMDGIEAGRIISKEMGIPVIFLTAYAMQEKLEEAKLIDPFGYIIKPFHEKNLHSLIEMSLYKHRIELKLKAERSRYYELYDGSPDGYMTVDESMRITEANRTLLHMLGDSPEEVIGKHMGDFFEHIPALGEAREVSIKSSMLINDGSSIPVLIKVKSFNPERSSDKGMKIVVRDLTEIRKLEADKEILSQKIIKLTKRIPLTQNERQVFQRLLKRPGESDTEISEALGIKRSTVTSIRNRLLAEGFYKSYRIPNFENIGTEIMTVFYATLNLLQTDFKVREDTFQKTFSRPEQVFLQATQTELIGVCLSRNLTDVVEHLNQVSMLYKQADLASNFRVSYFPVSLSTIELHGFSGYLGKLFDLGSDDDTLIYRNGPKASRTLTSSERSILYHLVKHPDKNDSELSIISRLPRPSISQARRKLEETGMLSNVNLPVLLQLRSDLSVLEHFVYTPGQYKDVQAIKDRIVRSGNVIFIASSSTEMMFLSVYDDFAEYESTRNAYMILLHKTGIEVRTTRLHSVPDLQYQNLDMSLITAKLLGFPTGPAGI